MSTPQPPHTESPALRPMPDDTGLPDDGALRPDFDTSRPLAEAPSPDERAREIEEQMTDDERFLLVISALGQVPNSTAAQTRDPLIPEDVKNMSAGYTPGVPRLGVPAIQSSDASMGITNPGTRAGTITS